MTRRKELLCQQCLLREHCHRPLEDLEKGLCPDFIRAEFQGICKTCKLRNSCEECHKEGGVWNCPDFE